MRLLQKLGFIFLLPFAMTLNGLELNAKPKTLVYCIEADAEHFSPGSSTDANTHAASAHTIYDRLVDFKSGTTEVVPSIAKSWDVSEDGLTYTFNLRKDVKFQSNKDFKPTRNLNADDVIFSFDRQNNKNNPFHAVTSSSYMFWEYLNMPKIIKEIKKIDDYTVAFVLNEKNSVLVTNLAVSAFPIHSKEYADFILDSGKDKITYDKKPIGTGPYKLVQHQKGNLIRFKAHKDHFNGPAKIENLLMKVATESSQRYSKLKAGECHIMSNPTPADIVTMQNDSDIKIMQKAAPNIAYLTFNQSKKPFDDIRVRKALAMSINKEEIIKKVYLGNADNIHSMIPPALWSHDGDLRIPYDPETAKKLMTELGYSKENPLEIELWYMPVQRAYMPSGRKAAELIQAHWAEIGVNAEIVTYDWQLYIQKAKNFEHSAFMLGWTTDNGDPDNFASLLSCAAIKGKSNFAHWCNEDYDKLIAAGMATADKTARTQIYMDAQKVFAEQVPWLPIASSKVTVAVRKEVEGFPVNPTILWEFDNVELKQ